MEEKNENSLLTRCHDYKGEPPQTWNYLVEGRPLVVQASPVRSVF